MLSGRLWRKSLELPLTCSEKPIRIHQRFCKLYQVDSDYYFDSSNVPLKVLVPIDDNGYVHFNTFSQLFHDKLSLCKYLDSKERCDALDALADSMGYAVEHTDITNNKLPELIEGRKETSRSKPFDVRKSSFVAFMHPRAAVLVAKTLCDEVGEELAKVLLSDWLVPIQRYVSIPKRLLPSVDMPKPLLPLNGELPITYVRQIIADTIESPIVNIPDSFKSPTEREDFADSLISDIQRQMESLTKTCNQLRALIST